MLPVFLELSVYYFKRLVLLQKRSKRLLWLIATRRLGDGYSNISCICLPLH